MANFKERCRMCGKPILLLKTVKGKTMPCDPEPVYFAPQIYSEKRFVLPDATTFHGEIVPYGDPDAHLAYICHWDTCSMEGLPNAKRRRRK